MSFRFLRSTLHASKPLLARSNFSTALRPVVRPLVLCPTLQRSRYFARTFSISSACLNNGEVDPDLAHLLQEELNFAKAEKEETPAFIQEFLDTHLFQIEDTEGDDKVTLRRQFGNEKISVLFSISDINHPVEEEEEVEADMDIPVTTTKTSDKVKEPRLDMEEATTDPLSGNVASRAAGLTDSEEHSHPPRSQENASFPVRATVMIEKEHKGSLVLTTVAQDGYIEIDSVRYFKEGDLKKEDLIKAEMDAPWKQDRYAGPVFEELEDELQATFSRYLEERGIDTALATFLPDYIDHKKLLL